MNTMKTKRDMSFEIQHAVKSLGVSYREIAIAANVGASTISRAARHGYKVNRSTHLAIAQGIQSLMPTHSCRCIATPVTDEYTPTATLAADLEKQVEQLRDTVEQTQLAPINFSDDQKAALKKPFNISYQTKEFLPNENAGLDVGVDLWNSSGAVKLQPDPFMTSGLVDDAIESAHSREKAELQKALAARINEVQNLAADVAHERVKNTTQAESIEQCLTEIELLKRLVALRTQDLAVYQKELEAADNCADDAEYKAAEFERSLTVQRAWTWLFVLLAFVAATVGVIK